MFFYYLGIDLQNDENRLTRCFVCDIFFDTYHSYNKHIQTDAHKTVFNELYKKRIDFENLKIFPPTSCFNMNEFLKSIEKEFTILVNHLLLKHISVLLDINLVTLYKKKTMTVETRNIAEIKMFYVKNVVIF